MALSHPTPIIPDTPCLEIGGSTAGATFAPLELAAPRQRGRRAPAPAGGASANGAGLGNGTGNVSAEAAAQRRPARTKPDPPQAGQSQPAAPAARRARNLARKFALLDSAAELLPTYRVAWCGRRVLDGQVRVLYHPEYAAASFGGVAVCGSVWTCPVCAARIALARADELARAGQVWAERGGQILMLTLTLRHQRQHRLSFLLAALNDAYRTIRQGRGFQAFKTQFSLAGSVTSREITEGKSGWHPHLHAILFLRRYVTPAELAEMKRYIYERWKTALKKHNLNATYERGVSLKEIPPGEIDYASKVAEAWAGANETTGALAKEAKNGNRTPQKLLFLASKGDKVAAARFIEYAAATKGLKMIVWSKGLRNEIFGEEAQETDQELAEKEQSKAIVMFEMTLSQWYRVLKYKLRGELLAECCTGDLDNAVQFLAGWGINILSSQMLYTFKGNHTV